MKLKEEILYLNSSFDNEQLNEILPKLNNKLIEIKEIIIEENSMLASSALFAIVASLKKSKQDIKVSCFDKSINFANLGNITFK